MLDLFIHSDFTIKETLKKLNRTAEKVLLVISDDRKLIGAITDGDIRRALLSGNAMNASIVNVYNRNPIYISESDWNNSEKIKKIFLKYKVYLLPIVNKDLQIIDFLTWDRLFAESHDEVFPKEKLTIPVVIMAGGKGTRLEPFTSVLPKPLIPVNGQTILEKIINQFQGYGITNYILILNYLGEMIKAYFSSIEHNLNLEFLFEDDYFGTAGSLKKLEKDKSETFIVSNCDILVNADYADALKFHYDNNAYLTILSAIQHHQIPYGVISFKKTGIVTKIDEKPETTVTVNTGVYMIDRKCFKYIPENTVFNMTDLIEKLLKDKKKVITYPVNSDDYLDIGQWKEYRKTIVKLSNNIS